MLLLNNLPKLKLKPDDQADPPSLIITPKAIRMRPKTRGRFTKN